MTETILVPVDGSDPADAALEFAVDRFPESEIQVLHVVNPLEVAYSTEAEAIGRNFWPEQFERSQAESGRILSAAEDLVGERSADVEFDSALGPPAETIVGTAEDRDVDQIIMGSHGRTGVTRVVMGSVAEKVLRRAPVPVTIVHGDDAP